MTQLEFNNIKAVVFDMDGLMFDSERMVQQSWDIAGQQLGYGPLGFHMPDTMGTNRVDREKYFINYYGEDFPFEEFLQTYRAAYYELTKDGVASKEGLHEILDVLQQHEIMIGLATSSSRQHALGNLRRENIEEYFQKVITGDMVDKGKPEPDIYKKACKALGVRPEEAVALEDSINGVKSAFRAGMKVVMIPDLVKDTSQVADMIVGNERSLLDVAKIIEESRRI